LDATEQDRFLYLAVRGPRGPSKAQYIEALSSFYRWARPGRCVRPAGPGLGVVFADWREDVRAQGRTERTLYHYTWCLVRFVAQATHIHDVTDATEHDLVAFLAELPPGSRIMHVKAFRSFYRWAFETRRMEQDPTGRLHPTKPPPKPTDAYSPSELDRVVEAARARSPQRAWAILACYGLGLRRRELARLEPADIEFDRRRVYIRDSKAGKSRWVEMTDVAEDALNQLRPWWNGTVLGGVTPMTFSKWVSQAAADAGLPPGRRRAHMLRSAYATNLRRAGARIEVVQSLLGHSSIATTQRYFQITEEERRSTVGLLDRRP
jgi:integrase/recombinase XerD